jgi:tripartite-type tricarboxylate transporter receptor subunit TctC
MEYKLGMIVKGDSPWETFGDMLDYAKKNPGKLRWNHPGRGTSLHMDALLIFRKAGVETIEIPNPKGAAESISALLGGHVDAATMPYGPAKDLMKAGKVRFLILYADHRYTDPPDVPCSSELGFPEAAKLNTYVGVYAHKNTPKDVQKTLFDAFQKTYEDPQFKKGIETLAEEPRFGGPEFMRDAIKKCEEVGVPLLKEFGLYVVK